MKQIFVLMLLILAYAFVLTIDYAHAAKHMVIGDHEVTINGAPHEEKVYVNGSLAYDNADGDRALNIKAQFETDKGDTLVFFLETLSGGTACPAMTLSGEIRSSSRSLHVPKLSVIETCPSDSAKMKRYIAGQAVTPESVYKKKTSVSPLSVSN